MTQKSPTQQRHDMRVVGSASCAGKHVSSQSATQTLLLKKGLPFARPVCLDSCAKVPKILPLLSPLGLVAQTRRVRDDCQDLDGLFGPLKVFR